MFVTGVQPAGSKGVSAVQVGAIDTKEVSRLAVQKEQEDDRAAARRPGDPQPVVFPRSGHLPLDQRPQSLRRQVAALRYRDDGGSDTDGESGDRLGR